MDARLLLLDNYDSFTFNLVQMFREHPLSIAVHRADQISTREVEGKEPDYLVISPGPKGPSCAGISVDVIRKLHRRVPILGVCLGMQCINEAFGGITVRAPVPVHGKTSAICHEQRGIFAGIPTPLVAARYHSLAVANVSPMLRVTATAADGVVMGISHCEYPVHGVQFHPESFMTACGDAIVKNFLATGKLGALAR